MSEFNYLAFNAQQAYFHDKSESSKSKQELNKQRKERKVLRLTKEYDTLMAEWLYRSKPKYTDMEKLCSRMLEVEEKLVELL